MQNETNNNIGSMSGTEGMGTGTGTTGLGTPGTGSSGSVGTDISGGSFGTTLASETGERCASCGQTIGGEGMEALLAKIGINDQILKRVREALADVDLDEQMRNVRSYLTESGGKAKDYAKANPAKIVGGLAALAIGAGVLMQTMKDRR